MSRKYHSGAEGGHTILVVDDSPEMLQTTRRLLEFEGHRVIAAADGRAGIDAFTEERPHLILVDYFMPEVTGEEFVRRVREVDPGVQIVLMTGYAGEKPPRVMMRELQIQGYHDKSDGSERLLLWVDSALKAYRHLQSMEKHRLGLQYILNITPDMHRLQPLEELLQGLLWQIEGLVGAENSFLATHPSDFLAATSSERSDPRSRSTAIEAAPEASIGTLAIRAGTGRFRPGVRVESLPDRERLAVQRALDTKQVSFVDGTSVVPLQLGEQTLGVIFVDQRPGGERDRKLLDVFAAQAAAAIRSAFLYGQNSLLFDLATKDPTTGVLLRGYGIQYFHQHLKRGHRNGLPVSVLLVDVDGFKQVNDRHGHVAGDEVLKTVGGLLLHTVRETDSVARYGGDEFLVVLPDTPTEGAAMVGRRIMEAARVEKCYTANEEIAIRLSVGGATLMPPLAGPDFGMLQSALVEKVAKRLLRAADQSLFAARGSIHIGRIETLGWEESGSPTVAA